MQTTKMKLRRSLFALLTGVMLVMPVASSAAFAADSKKADAKDSSSSSHGATGGGSVQGYAATSALQVGTIVQLNTDKSGTGKVSPATSKNMNQMFGATVDPHELSLTLSSDNLSNETYVANAGTYKVLVSSQGGAIQAGDFITLSAVDGVGMKAGTDEPTVFGRAVSSFDGKNGIGSVTLKDVSGNVTQKVTISTVQVSINIQRNPNKKSTKAEVPKFLQRIGQAIAEKPVGPLRIYLSIGITGLVIIVALTMLYAGIRHAIVAIGRNPLSKKSIFRGLLEVILSAFLILIIGLFAVYLILKL
jgi:hypothetical protein